MTIRTRVLGAFALVLIILAALGVNAYLAIGEVDRQARRVRASVDSNTAHVEFLVQLRSTLALGKLFAASEDAIDRENLAVAIAALNGASARMQAFGSGGVELGTLRLREEDYKRGLDGVISLIASRQRHATDLNEVLTTVQVFTSAIAERTASDWSRGPAALALLEGVEASGISALRYRGVARPVGHRGVQTVVGDRARGARPADGRQRERRRPPRQAAERPRQTSGEARRLPRRIGGGHGVAGRRDAGLGRVRSDRA